MKTSVSAKRCPECGRVAALPASQCLDCGHRFRTQFVEPDDRTQAFDAVLLPRPAAPRERFAPARRGPAPSAFLFAFLGSFCLVATLGILGWLAWDISRGAAPAHGQAVLSPAAHRARRAADLYERVGLSMSLYDLDQAAGGMGRVIRSPDPRAFLLSYDFPGSPGQSVHVLLTRPDLSDTDYRVQAVALYHGHTLLQRHADDN